MIIELPNVKNRLGENFTVTNKIASESFRCKTDVRIEIKMVTVKRL